MQSDVPASALNELFSEYPVVTTAESCAVNVPFTCGVRACSGRFLAVSSPRLLTYLDSVRRAVVAEPMGVLWFRPEATVVPLLYPGSVVLIRPHAASITLTALVEIKVVSHDKVMAELDRRTSVREAAIHLREYRFLFLPEVDTTGLDDDAWWAI